MTTTETALVSVDENQAVIPSTGEVFTPAVATEAQLRQFAIEVRDFIPEMSEDELDQLDAFLVGVAKRLRQLGKQAAQAEASRVLAVVRIGELLGPAEPEGKPYAVLPNGNTAQELRPTERKRRHNARLLAEFRDTVQKEIAERLPQDPPTLSLSRIVKICQVMRSTRDMPMTDRRFPILYADPPWRYEDARPNRQIENHYGTMSLDAIKALDVPAMDDAVLFLWVTSPKLTEGLDVIRSWGFQYRTCMVWVKDKIGMGYYARQQHELLLIAKRGELSVPKPENRPPSVFNASRNEHSAKPKIVYELIESMYPEYLRRSAEETCFCELFQRQPREGWYGWGLDTAVKP